VLNSLLRKDPNNVDVLFFKTLVLMDTGEIDEARKCANHILELDSNFKEVPEIKDILNS
jgi:hypothetical protein